MVAGLFAAALFDQRHEPEQRRRREAVIEHLEEHAIERGSFFRRELRRIGELRYRENR